MSQAVIILLFVMVAVFAIAETAIGSSLHKRWRELVKIEQQITEATFASRELTEKVVACYKDISKEREFLCKKELDLNTMANELADEKEAQRKQGIQLEEREKTCEELQRKLEEYTAELEKRLADTEGELERKKQELKKLEETPIVDVIDLEHLDAGREGRKQMRQELSEPSSVIHKKGGHMEPKRILQLDYNGEVVREYKSTAEAARTLGINATGITNCLKHRQMTSGGFRWKYANSK